MKAYKVTYQSKEAEAIGEFEKTTLGFWAENGEQAKEKARAHAYSQNREHVLITEAQEVMPLITEWFNRTPQLLCKGSGLSFIGISQDYLITFVLINKSPDSITAHPTAPSQRQNSHCHCPIQRGTDLLSC